MKWREKNTELIWEEIVFYSYYFKQHYLTQSISPSIPVEMTRNRNMKKDHTYYVYIIANPSRSVIYIGMTNSLTRRLQEHKNNRGTKKSFAGRNYCYELLYYEVYQYVNEAIAREKELKKWSRAKKDALIKSQNPRLLTLNREFYVDWWNRLLLLSFRTQRNAESLPAGRQEVYWVDLR